ncbi:hypothetical protein CapIbe_012965 [Capra ibex]
MQLTPGGHRPQVLAGSCNHPMSDSFCHSQVTLTDRMRRGRTEVMGSVNCLDFCAYCQLTRQQFKILTLNRHSHLFPEKIKKKSGGSRQSTSRRRKA